VAALNAAENCAEVLGESSVQQRFAVARGNLTRAINATWDAQRGSYPDAILEDGRPSAKRCQHNAALSLIAGVLPNEHVEVARGHLLNPPEDMVKIGSPFAAQFLFEAFELLNEPQAILDNIRMNYTPMIEAGATTVWETYPNSTCSPEGFPTRSHCHGWSCGPLQFFNQIILGIRQTAAGGTAFEISPWLDDLQFAQGAMMTPRGPVSVAWKIAEGRLEVSVDAPEDVEIRWAPNTSHEGLEIQLTGVLDDV
jgi:alpha-L-rhamnosidase